MKVFIGRMLLIMVVLLTSTIQGGGEKTPQELREMNIRVNAQAEALRKERLKNKNFLHKKLAKTIHDQEEKRDKSFLNRINKVVDNLDLESLSAEGLLKALNERGLTIKYQLSLPDEDESLSSESEGSSDSEEETSPSQETSIFTTSDYKEKAVARSIGTQAARLFVRSFPSTEHKTETKLIHLINNETEAIRASLYELNSYPVAYALCQKSKNLDIKILLEDGCKNSIALLLIKHCNIPIKFCSPKQPLTNLSGGIMHQKVFIFSANKGKRFLLDENDEKDSTDLFVTQDDEYDKETKNSLPVPFYWDGSFNITGAAREKNIESTTVTSDSEALPKRIKEFETLWNNKNLCFTDKASTKSTKKNPLKKTKLARLEHIEIKDTDIKINKVPSKNALYLLQSKFLRKNGSYSFLTLDEILKYKDFVPTAMTQQSYLKTHQRFAKTYATMKQLIPNDKSLPNSCYLNITGKKTMVRIEEEWIPLDDILE